ATADGRAAGGASDRPAISADGRFVVFASAASDLTGDDANGGEDVFVHDMTAGKLTRVSTNAAGEEGDAASGLGAVAVSGDGRYVAFDSAASNLVDGDGNAKRDIFVKDTTGGAVTRISTGAAGEEGQEDSYMSVSLSADGSLAVFQSNAPNLIPGDANARSDIFLRDMKSGAVTIVSMSAAGAQGKEHTESARISGDGERIAFDSLEALVAADTNRKRDVFLKLPGAGPAAAADDPQAETLIRVSTSTSRVLD
ncbi:MAG: hypothetical protein AB1760_20540, partial [Pseudomonadota bacterium]